MQKIQAGHLDGSVILVGSVGSSVGPLDCSLSLLLPSPDENEDESVQLLVRPERSAGSVLIVTGGDFLLRRGGEETDMEVLTRLLAGDGLVMPATVAVRLAGSRLIGLLSTCNASCSSAVVVEEDSADGGFRPNSGLRMFSTEKGKTLETDWDVGDDCRSRLSGCIIGGGASGGAN